MNDDGYVEINGRLKDLIIRGGENVYPAEVEQFLYKHPKIADVQVVNHRCRTSDKLMCRHELGIKTLCRVLHLRTYMRNGLQVGLLLFVPRLDSVGNIFKCRRVTGCRT